MKLRSYTKADLEGQPIVAITFGPWNKEADYTVESAEVSYLSEKLMKLVYGKRYAKQIRMSDIGTLTWHTVICRESDVKEIIENYIEIRRVQYEKEIEALKEKLTKLDNFKGDFRNGSN